MKEQLATIRSEALAAFAQAGSSAELDALRVKYLGKKGELTAVLKQMGKLSAEERPAMGQLANEVRAALADFQSEVALRVGYFTESADSIAALVRQAYYDEPAGALGMPEFTVSLYPASGGQQRIVEILLTYPEDTQALRQKSDDLQSTADALVLPLRPHQLSPSARQAELFSLVREHVRARPDGGSTAWDALLGDGADSEGLALAMALVCQYLDIPCQVVQGTQAGEPHFWNVVSLGEFWRHLDLTGWGQQNQSLFTDEAFQTAGYTWDTALVPQCRTFDTTAEGN